MSQGVVANVVSVAIKAPFLLLLLEQGDYLIKHQVGHSSNW
jgi:hypothetical protein